MNEQSVGIDVSKSKLDVCVLKGEKLKTKVFRNTRAGHVELSEWLRQRELLADTPIVLEAGFYPVSTDGYKTTVSFRS